MQIWGYICLLMELCRSSVSMRTNQHKKSDVGVEFNQRHKPYTKQYDIHFSDYFEFLREDIRFYWGIGHYTFGKVLVISTVKGKT